MVERGGHGGTNFYSNPGFPPIKAPDGKNGVGGGSIGGALANDESAVSLINCTIAYNFSLPGKGGLANGGGLQNRSGAKISLGNTLLASNLSGTNAANAAGLLSDLGHNLSSDGTCAWTRTSSRSQIDPKLGRLDDYGGPTSTLPLAADSPARDSGSTFLGPATDQRGVVRPFGLATDIGAIEYEEANTPEPLRVAAVTEGAVTLRWTAGLGIRVQHARSLGSAAWEDLPGTLGKHAAVLNPEETIGYFRLSTP